VLTALACSTLKGTLYPYFIILGKFEQQVPFPEPDWIMRGNMLGCPSSAIADHGWSCVTVDYGASCASVASTVHIAPVSYVKDRHRACCVVNVIDNAIVPNTHPPTGAIGQLHTPWWAWIVCQGINSGGDASTVGH
jgi:hypothetical protein